MDGSALLNASTMLFSAVDGLHFFHWFFLLALFRLLFHFIKLPLQEWIYCPSRDPLEQWPNSFTDSICCFLFIFISFLQWLIYATAISMFVFIEFVSFHLRFGAANFMVALELRYLHGYDPLKAQ